MSSAGDEFVRVVLYYSGRKFEGREGIVFEGEKRQTRLKRSSTMGDLHQRIRQKLALQDSQSIIQLTGRIWQRERYMGFQVVDDEDLELLFEEFFKLPTRDFIELYVDFRVVDDVLPIMSVAVNAAKPTSSYADPVVNVSAEDSHDPTWVMDDDEDDDDDENIVMEDQLLQEDASASDNDDDAGVDATGFQAHTAMGSFGMHHHPDVGGSQSEHDVQGAEVTPFWDGIPHYTYIDWSHPSEEDSFSGSGSGSGSVQGPWQLGDPLFVQQQFATKKEAQIAVKRNLMKEHQEAVLVESKPNKFSMKCIAHKEGCPWRVRVTKPAFGEKWIVSRWGGNHNCLNDHISQGHRQLDADVIASIVVGMIKEEPSVSIALVRERITHTFGFRVSYRKAWFAKQKAMAMVYGNWEESYAFLPRWCAYMLRFSPASASSCSASTLTSGGCGKATKIGVVVGVITTGALVVAGLFLLCYCARRRSTWLRKHTMVKRQLREAAGNSSVPFYPYKEIEKATNFFSEKHRLGTGAFGTVYAGKLHNDEWVAIKKLRQRDTNSADQVMNEIKLLSSVSHPNLVRLLGCCIEKGEHILVYEFMQNGTLSQHLQRERSKGLPWTIRLTIATETANAIAYLHSSIHPPIYHRDIKSTNILLDYGFKSKIADFGLSRLALTETSHISTAPQGTPGYVDPQYHQNFQLSDKSDVYSFGVVLVEIITAMKVVDFARPRSEINLAALAVDRIRRGAVDEIIDPFLEPHRDAWTLYSIHKVAELAFRCLAFHSDMRPTMMEVAEELEHIRRSGWASMEETLTASPIGSTSSSPRHGSEKSLGVIKKARQGQGSERLIVPQKTESFLQSLEVKDSSPVSVHDPIPWSSGHSSPSSNSLLGNVIP